MNVTRVRRLVRTHGTVGVLLAALWLLGHVCAAWLRRHRIAGILLVLLGFALSILFFFRVKSSSPAPRATLLSFGALRQPLRVTFLDVGKGDAIVLETPSGKCLVIDTGGVQQDGDMGRKVIAPYLRGRKCKRLDLLLLTHPHPDHVGGATTLLQQWPVTQLVDNGLDSTNKTYKRYREEAKKRNVPCVVAARGWCLDCGDGVTLQALAPPPPPKDKLGSAGEFEADTTLPPFMAPPVNVNNVSSAQRSPLNAYTSASQRLMLNAQRSTLNVNNTSIVLRVTYGKTVFLLTGDAEADSENEMLGARQPLRSDVLKVGHHGGKQSTTTKFLKAVKPHYAVISVDANNRNGHPHPDVLERLRQAGSQILRTDEHGNLTCTSDGRALHWETSR